MDDSTRKPTDGKRDPRKATRDAFKVPLEHFGTGAIGRLRKSVWVVIAVHADVDGTNSTVAWDTIALEVGCSRSTAYRVTLWLEAHGFLKITHKGGRVCKRGITNRYDICFDDSKWVKPEPRASHMTPGHDHVSTSNDHVSGSATTCQTETTTCQTAPDHVSSIVTLNRCNDRINDREYDRCNDRSTTDELSLFGEGQETGPQELQETAPAPQTAQDLPPAPGLPADQGNPPKPVQTPGPVFRQSSRLQDVVLDPNFDDSWFEEGQRKLQEEERAKWRASSEAAAEEQRRELAGASRL
jgi:hypothetical protein